MKISSLCYVKLNIGCEQYNKHKMLRTETILRINARRKSLKEGTYVFAYIKFDIHKI